MPNVVIPKEGDWKGTINAIRKMSYLRLGPDSAPTIRGLAITSALSASSAVFNSTLISTLTVSSSATISVLVVSSANISNVAITTADIGSAHLDTLVADAGTISALTVTSGVISTLQIIDAIATGTVDVSLGKIRVRDDDTTKPTSQNDGYLSVYKDGSTARIYAYVNGERHYVNLTFESEVVIDGPPETGVPMGLLLALTYTT